MILKIKHSTKTKSDKYHVIKDGNNKLNYSILNKLPKENNDFYLNQLSIYTTLIPSKTKNPKNLLEITFYASAENVPLQAQKERNE